jgi:hypothetical protein
MEDSWMKSISSGTVCGWFYFLFVWQSVMAALAILGVFGVAFMGGKLGIPKAARLIQVATLVVGAGIAVASALFMYILCERAIVQKGEESE